jgi:transcriptional regulator with XRE-family HTH domain
MNVGNAIRECRKRRGVSQTDIALRADCSVSYLSMLENNKRDPTLSMVSKIAAALQVPVGVLFVMASEQKELGKIGGELAGKIERAVMASLPAQSDAKAIHG